MSLIFSRSSTGMANARFIPESLKKKFFGGEEGESTLRHIFFFLNIFFTCLMTQTQISFWLLCLSITRLSLSFFFFLHIHFFKESFSYWLLLRLIFAIVPL